MKLVKRFDRTDRHFVLIPEQDDSWARVTCMIDVQQPTRCYNETPILTSLKYVVTMQLEEVVVRNMLIGG